MQYPMIAQPQYAFAPTMPMMAGGGLASAARNLADKGRYGDSMLVHMRPDEVAGLASLARAQGGSITINPHTGLPEAWGIKSITKPISKAFAKLDDAIIQKVTTPIKDLAVQLGPIGQVAAAFVPGVGPYLSAIMAGAADPNKKFAWGKALANLAGQEAFRAVSGGESLTGMGSYGTPSVDPGMLTDTIGESYAVEGGLPGGGTAASPVTDLSSIPYESGADLDLSGISGGETAPTASSTPTYTADTSMYNAGDMTDPITGAGTGQDITGYEAAKPNFAERMANRAVDSYERTLAGIKSLPSDIANYDYSQLPERAVDYLAEAPGKIADWAVDNPDRAAIAGYMGYSGYRTKKELDAQKKEAARILADQENQKAEDIAWARSVMSTYRPTYARAGAQDVAGWGTRQMAQGGITALAAGGSMPPRYLSGGGDGMSDSIKANIDGKQEARLADGEFVVPADVVSHLGNGSSNAGAKRLYAMMDKVRKARTGKKSQAPAVNVQKMMPV